MVFGFFLGWKVDLNMINGKENRVVFLINVFGNNYSVWYGFDI